MDSNSILQLHFSCAYPARHLWNKVTHEVQFYLSSLPADAQNLGNAIRTHWGIENQVHWRKGRNF